MRVGWITPLSAEFAAGAHALEVVREMRERGVSAEIVRADADAVAQLPALPDDIPFRQLNQTGIEALRESFDLLVVALVNHFEVGSSSLEILRSMPSVGVFYDADLSNLCSGVVRAGLSPNAVDVLRTISPAQAGEPSFGEDLAWVASLCAGGIVQGRHFLEPVKANCPGPAIVISPCVRDRGPARLKRHRTDFTIVTIDQVTGNEQIDRLMRAVARSPLLKDRVVCRFIGKVPERDRQRLHHLAGQLGIRPAELHEDVGDARLHDVLAAAHVICCLRDPIEWDRSRMLIQALQSGVPVIVADAEEHADVPGDMVWKVAPGNEIETMTALLESIARDQVAADSRAAAAREWACRTYSVVAHVDRLMPFLEECLAELPMIEAGRQLGTVLYDMGASFEDPLVKRVGNVLQDLFKGPTRAP